jgi:hypothetical protein
LQGTVPDGESDELGFPGFERDETNGWVFGNHPGQTPSQAQQFKEMLIAHKHCFAYLLLFFFFLQTDSYKNHSETSPVINPGGLRCGPRGRKGQALKTPSIIIGINLSS